MSGQRHADRLREPKRFAERPLTHPACSPGCTNGANAEQGRVTTPPLSLTIRLCARPDTVTAG